MKPEKVVLCASSKYEQKFYLNEEFKGRNKKRIKNHVCIVYRGCRWYTEA